MLRFDDRPTVRRATVAIAAAAALSIGTLAAPAHAVLTPGDSARSTAALARAKAKITLMAVDVPSPLVTGTQVTFKGTAPMKLAGKRAALYRRVNAAEWIKVGNPKIRRNGTFKATGVATGAGTNSWKVSLKKSKKKTLTSAVAGTKVFAWYNLADHEAVNSRYWGEGPVSVGGINYIESVYSAVWGTSSWGEYNLSYRCHTFRADIGVDDESETGYEAAMSANLDGAEHSFGTLRLGRATRVTLDVQSRLRIRLNVTPLDSDLEGWGVFGNAAVLCSGNP